jgi:hypothetical protein
VFGCGYRRIADHTCSASTLRRRRDQWVTAGIMLRLERIVLDAYDQLIGLELSDLAVDGCITKAPCGGQTAGPSPVDPWQARPETVGGNRRQGDPAGCRRRRRQHA